MDVYRAGAEYWIVVYVVGGRERSAAEFLEKRGLDCYVPMGRRTVRARRGARAEVRFPAFPNYLFARIDPEVPGWGALDGCRDVLAIVRVERANELVPCRLSPAMIERVRANEAAGLFDAEREGKPAFREGTAVRIERGAFEGLAGTVRRMVGRNGLLIEVCGRRVKLDVDFLAPLGL